MILVAMFLLTTLQSDDNGGREDEHSPRKGTTRYGHDCVVQIGTIEGSGPVAAVDQTDWAGLDSARLELYKLY